MFIIISKRKLDDRIQRAAEIRAGEVWDRYSDNPKLLKAAREAFEGVSAGSADRLNVGESEQFIKPMKRAIRAFAAGLAEERAEVGRV